MKKIDKETVSRILDTADIVDVVSDFVALRRRGANYIGLCPFHSERTPSFSVSKAKGICKCFSCGKGGSPVAFLMELEQMSFQEALRWLAKKYNIPIKEHEETEKEREEATEREALFAVNSFALKHFEHNLFDTEDGRLIGLAYFTERGLTEETIRKFQLGYALEKSDDLYKSALSNGFSKDYLLKSGLCAESERGVYDRFRGRVMYPVHTMSGKIVAFGGRTLKTDKNVAKYVNSPESSIYSKSRELYGLFQARREIVRLDECILVEGYMDVLSMSQAGVENVVASSGTSLTTQQVKIIHRFTNNVTVIYDADAAGIKASLRGVDMLLAEGMKVSVVLFPEGEDPDSYAQSHSKQELADYLEKNKTDFISFKSSVLLKGIENDPMARSAAINDILRSIAVIPDMITRQIYIDESARTFGMDAKMLARVVAKISAENKEKEYNENLRNRSERSLDAMEGNDTETAKERLESSVGQSVEGVPGNISRDSHLLKFEEALMRYLIRYGMVVISVEYNEDSSESPVTVLDYVNYEFAQDGTSFSNPTMARMFDRLNQAAAEWAAHEADINAEVAKLTDEMRRDGLEKIRNSASSISEIVKEEKKLEELIARESKELENQHRISYFRNIFLNDPDDEIRRYATDFVIDRHTLSKYHSKFAKIETERDRLPELLPRCIFELRDAILQKQISTLHEQIAQCSNQIDVANVLIEQLMEKMKVRAEFARFLGDRIITPRKN